MRKLRKFLKNSIYGKILKIVWTIIKISIELLILALVLIILVPRFTNNQKTFMGYRIFNVATGSMEPQINVGDIIISKEINPKDVKVGDTIVYAGNKTEYNGKIITHSVIKIEQNSEGKYLFHTKGIANNVEDPIVKQEQVMGKVININPILTWICKIMTNRYGLYFVVIVPVTIYAFVGFVKAQEAKMEARIKLKKEQEENETKE